jgi:hypothetical protein
MFWIKLLISGLLIALATESAKRSGKVGGLILSLPLTSILALCWIWWESREPEKVARMTLDTLWFILPSLVLFVTLPLLLRKGIPFGWAMTLSVACTMGSYALFFKLST